MNKGDRWVAAAARAFLFVAVWAMTFSTVIHAQTVVGTWQGTLPALQYPRTMLKISKSDDGSLRGVVYRYDESAESIPLSEVSFRALEFHAAVVWLDVDFKGKMSADGKSIAGTWTQKKHAYPLTLELATPDTLWTYTRATPLAPMATTADPAFEVATIKPTAPEEKQRGNIRGRHFSLTRYSVDELIEFAYQVRRDQIESVPAKAEWMSTQKFDVAGEPDAEGQPSPEQVRLMVKKLLADRFQLKLHTVQRGFPVFALVVDKPSAKVRPTDKSVTTRTGIFPSTTADGQVAALFSGMSMQEFTTILMNFIKSRHIVDETGLVGQYDFTLTVPVSATQGGEGNSDPADDFFRAVQQVGFKLVAKRADLTVLVVDAVEKPSAN